MKTNERLIDTLIESGATRAFTLPGLGVTWILPALYDRRESFELVLCRSEQTASVMAQVAGRLTGKPGVFMGQGPWVCSTGLFGIIEASFAGSPMLVITDTSDYNGYGLYGCYQSMTGGYGALDIQPALRSATKYCAYATDPEEVVFGAQMAYKHAMLPRQGPAALIMKTTVIREEFPEKPKTSLYPSKGYYAYTPSRSDAKAIADVLPMLENRGLSNAKRDARLRTIRRIKDENGYDEPKTFVAASGTVAFSEAVRDLQTFIGKDDILSIDAGTSRIWITNALRIRHQNQLLAPAAASAKLTLPEKRVTAFVGDGAFMMTADVIATCAQYNVGAVFVVANNRGLGMVRDNLGENRIACDLEDIDFARMAEGMGAKGYTVNDSGMFGDVLREAHKQGGPVVIDLKMDPKDSHHLVSDSRPLV